MSAKPPRPEARAEAGARAAGLVSTPEGGRALRSFRPIVPEPLRTTGHGPAEAPLRAALAERSPGIRATDARPDGLGGAVSVRVPPGSGR